MIGPRACSFYYFESKILALPYSLDEVSIHVVHPPFVGWLRLAPNPS